MPYLWRLGANWGRRWKLSVHWWSFELEGERYIDIGSKSYVSSPLLQCCKSCCVCVPAFVGDPFRTKRISFGACPSQSGWVRLTTTTSASSWRRDGGFPTNRKHFWELDGNAAGPHWEPKMTEKHTPGPTLRPQTKPRRKNLNPLSLHIGCRKRPFPKRFVTVFSLDLYPQYRLALLTKCMVSSVDDPLFVMETVQSDVDSRVHLVPHFKDWLIDWFTYFTYTNWQYPLQKGFRVPWTFPIWTVVALQGAPSALMQFSCKIKMCLLYTCR
jgi:hypothetical protein